MTSPRYRLVIFDFDGTLANSFPWFVSIFNDVAERFNFRPIGDGELEELRGLSGRELVRHLGVPAWKLPAIARHVRRTKARDLDAVPLFPGAEPLLRRLAAETELALVTSNSLDNVRRILGPRNCELFRHYQCGVSTFGKRRGFQRVLKRSGVDPADALAVGDEIRDLEAARGAGIAFGAVGWGYTRPDALRRHAPDHTFTTLEEIADLVLPPRSPRTVRGHGEHGPDSRLRARIHPTGERDTP